MQIEAYEFTKYLLSNVQSGPVDKVIAYMSLTLVRTGFSPSNEIIAMCDMSVLTEGTHAFGLGNISHLCEQRGYITLLYVYM